VNGVAAELQRQQEELQRQQGEEPSSEGTTLVDKKVGGCEVEDPWWRLIFWHFYFTEGGPNVVCACWFCGQWMF
jgi:hypothetical protein